MSQSKAYVSLARDGSVRAVCIIVDERQSKQAIRSLRRSLPDAPIAEMSVTQALAAMRAHREIKSVVTAPKVHAPHRHLLRQGNM